jgi:hypothetical protein
MVIPCDDRARVEGVGRTISEKLPLQHLPRHVPGMAPGTKS